MITKIEPLRSRGGGVTNNLLVRRLFGVCVFPYFDSFFILYFFTIGATRGGGGLC